MVATRINIEPSWRHYGSEYVSKNNESFVWEEIEENICACFQVQWTCQSVETRKEYNEPVKV